MNSKEEDALQATSTRFSPDGCTAFVRLRVDRRNYEFARHWAAVHAEADPEGTAEDQLEGYLAMALMEHMERTQWEPSQEIENLYLRTQKARKPREERDRGVVD